MEEATVKIRRFSIGGAALIFVLAMPMVAGAFERTGSVSGVELAAGAVPRLFTSSKLHSQLVERGASEAPKGITFPRFEPAEFPFVTTLPDIGSGEAGGWQLAHVNLEFTRIVLPFTVIKWSCPFKIGMPLRTVTRGKISPGSAATMSATVANIVTSGIDFKLPQGVFCVRFVGDMRTTFKSTYPLLGERVIW